MIDLEEYPLPWGYTDVFDTLHYYADMVNYSVTSLGDVPGLINALEDHGQFGTAQHIHNWYQDIMRKMNAEYKALDTNKKQEENHWPRENGFCICGRFECERIVEPPS